MKVYGETGCIKPHIPDLDTNWRWAVSFTPRPLFPLRFLDRRLSGPQNQYWRRVEDNIFDPAGIRNKFPRRPSSRYTDHANPDKTIKSSFVKYLYISRFVRYSRRQKLFPILISQPWSRYDVTPWRVKLETVIGHNVSCKLVWSQPGLLLPEIGQWQGNYIFNGQQKRIALGTLVIGHGPYSQGTSVTDLCTVVSNEVSVSKLIVHKYEEKNWQRMTGEKYLFYSLSRIYNLLYSGVISKCVVG
jgi:hypothetical protein